MSKDMKDNLQDIVLRSGYAVPYDPLDAVAMVEHLRQAIVGESLRIAGEKQLKSWDDVAGEVVAEITHLSTTVTTEVLHCLLVALLSDTSFDLLIAIGKDHGLEKPAVH